MVVYYIGSGWLGDQYCLLLAKAVILVEANICYILHQNYPYNGRGPQIANQKRWQMEFDIPYF